MTFAVAWALLRGMAWQAGLSRAFFAAEPAAMICGKPEQE
jgi:hypothetical protein